MRNIYHHVQKGHRAPPCTTARILLALLLSAATFIAAPKVHAKEQNLIVFSPSHKQSEMSTFQEAVEAYLGQYKIQLLIKQTDSFPSEIIDQIEAAREQITTDSCIGAMWIDFERSTVNILVIRNDTIPKDPGAEQVLTRSFPNLGEGWEAECEAIAAFVRFAVANLLEESVSRTEDDDQRLGVQVLDDERPWSPVVQKMGNETVPKKEWTPSGNAVFSASAGYTSIWTDSFKLVHRGASISALTTFFDQWLIFYSVDVLNFYDSPSSENTIHRLPMNLGTAVFLRYPKYLIGFRFAANLDTVYFRSDTSPTYHRYNPGMDAGLIFHSKINSFLSFFATAKLNVYLNEYKIASQEIDPNTTETVDTDRYQRVQPQFCIGFEVWRSWKAAN